MTEITTYARALYKLLPPGLCFNNEAGSNTNKLLTALAQEFVRIEDRALDLIQEANPLTTSELLDTRYKEAGLPSSCSNVAAATVQEKRSEILAAWTNVGGASKQFFLDVLATFGITATIDEFYVTGELANCVSTCTSALFDPEQLGTFRVNYIDTTMTDFVAGGSVAGEPLGSFSETNGFECLLNKLKPAHTTILFNPVASL